MYALIKDKKVIKLFNEELAVVPDDFESIKVPEGQMVYEGCEYDGTSFKLIQFYALVHKNKVIEVKNKKFDIPEDFQWIEIPQGDVVHKGYDWDGTSFQEIIITPRETRDFILFKKIKKRLKEQHDLIIEMYKFIQGTGTKEVVKTAYEKYSKNIKDYDDEDDLSKVLEKNKTKVVKEYTQKQKDKKKALKNK